MNARDKIRKAAADMCSTEKTEDLSTKEMETLVMLINNNKKSIEKLEAHKHFPGHQPEDIDKIDKQIAKLKKQIETYRKGKLIDSKSTDASPEEKEIYSKYEKQLEALYAKSKNDKTYQEKMATKKMEEELIRRQNVELAKVRKNASDAVKPSFIDILNDPKGKSLIEQIEDIGETTDPTLLSIKKKLIAELRQKFNFVYDSKGGNTMKDAYEVEISYQEVYNMLKKRYDMIPDARGVERAIKDLGFKVAPGVAKKIYEALYDDDSGYDSKTVDARQVIRDAAMRINDAMPSTKGFEEFQSKQAEKTAKAAPGWNKKYEEEAKALAMTLKKQGVEWKQAIAKVNAQNRELGLTRVGEIVKKVYGI